MRYYTDRSSRLAGEGQYETRKKFAWFPIYTYNHVWVWLEHVDREYKYTNNAWVLQTTAEIEEFSR